VVEQAQDSMISPVESKDIFEEEKEDLQINKLDFAGFNHPTSRNQSNNSIGKDRSSEVVNYETRQPQTSQITESLPRAESERKTSGDFVNNEYYQMMPEEHKLEDNQSEKQNIAVPDLKSTRISDNRK